MCCVIADLFSMWDSCTRTMSTSDRGISCQLRCCHSSLLRSLNNYTAFNNYFFLRVQNHLFGVRLFLSGNYLAFFGSNSICHGDSFPLKNWRNPANHKCNNMNSVLKYLLDFRAPWFKTHKRCTASHWGKSRSARRTQLTSGAFRFNSFWFSRVSLLSNLMDASLWRPRLERALRATEKPGQCPCSYILWLWSPLVTLA